MKIFKDNRNLYVEQQRIARIRHANMLHSALSIILPKWRYAKDRSAEPRFLQCLEAYDFDDVPDWARHTPEIIPTGSIVDFGQLGRFRIGDTKQVIHKRLARNMPWELPNAVLLAELSHRCDPGAVIVDIGANIGTLTIPIGKIFSGKVLAFEPVEPNFRALIDSIELNDLANVTACFQACSRTPGFGTMNRILDKNPGLAQLLICDRGLTQVVTVDQATAGLSVALIKMDVEGHEPHVIAGAEKTLLQDKPLIICEILKGATTKDDLEALGYNGFKFFRSDWVFYAD